MYVCLVSWRACLSVCLCVRACIRACLPSCLSVCMSVCLSSVCPSVLFSASWVINQYFRGVKRFAQGHNTAAVGLEPPTSRSGVRQSTTEPPRSRMHVCMPGKLTCVSVCLCVRACVRASLPSCLSVCMSVSHLSACLSVCLAVCLPACLSVVVVCLSVCPDFPIQCNKSEVRSKN